MLKRIKTGFILSTFLFFFVYKASAQTYTFQESLNWQINTNSLNPKIFGGYFLGFTGAGYTLAQPAAPVYSKRIPVSAQGTVRVSLSGQVFAAVDDTVIARQLHYLTNEIHPQYSWQEIDHKPYLMVSFVPLRKNPSSGALEKLVSFTVTAVVSPSAPKAAAGQNKTSSGSLLATGTWYKIGVGKTGIYKLDYNFLRGLGIPDHTNMSAIKIYGRPGGMLPQLNTAPRDNDLVQNAVQVVSGSGVLDGGSYILFYAKGPTAWTYDSTSHRFHHQINYYSDVSYYFVTYDGDAAHPQKTIAQGGVSGTAAREITGFDAYDYHELDTVTSITTSVKSGREWYGEDFSAYKTTLPHNINFDFPQADLTRNAYIRTSTAARSYPGITRFAFSVDGGNSFISKASVSPVGSLDDFSDSYAAVNENAQDTFAMPSSHLAFQVGFVPGYAEGLGWLNYVEFNVPSVLRYIPGQFGFRSAASIGKQGEINRFHLTGAPSGYTVWDVTDFHNVVSMPLAISGGEATFMAPAGSIHEFVANDGSGFMTPSANGQVQNQDLHSLPQPDMVIVAYPDFRQTADSIANYHRTMDNMVVHVVTPQQVYNEFSSGTQDISALRDMLKMFYDRGKTSGATPKFLLLVGAASYDYKDRVKNHTNFVPTYEGYQSIFAALSFCSDDYFTLLADGEGAWSDNELVNEPLQMCVGRLPVYTNQQGMDIYHKIIRYNQGKSMADWRNRAVFVADDRFYNEFVKDAETLAGMVNAQYGAMNVKKIYLDATTEVNTPAGQLFPEVNTMVNQNMAAGCLFMDYIGHGGQQYLAHEKVITIPDINSWNNPYKMPLLITATCQFSTFDDPDNVSAGQLALLNPMGGPFAMLTTTREVDAFSNTQLNDAIMNHNLLVKDANGKGKYIGQIFKDAKNIAQVQSNSRNFALLGDPAVRLALPEYTVKLTNITRGKLASDTFKALSLMTLKGEISDGSKILDNFNGDIYPTVYDKAETKRTLGQAVNDPSDPDYVMTFSTQENIIYKGHASVDSGKFSFSFVVPKDISFDYGKGKLSFYAANASVDANGYSDSIIVGGSDENATQNHKPPHVDVYMNDTNFRAGGIVNNTPVLVARVHSELGINTLGSIGHNLVATLGRYGDTFDAGDEYILNDYYSADKNSYTMGTISYPFASLPDGHYQLNVKVWDVANNSADGGTDFIVVSKDKLTIDKIFNYPNPFTDETTFQFEHNRPNENLHIILSIFDLNGRRIQDFESDVMTTGDRETSLHWNARQTSNGATVSSGLYVYEITVKTSDGQVASKSSKMLLVK